MLPFTYLIPILPFLWPVAGFPVADGSDDSLTGAATPLGRLFGSRDLALAARGYDEHVTLANCKNVNGSNVGYEHSEVAYSVRSPVHDPKQKDLVWVSDGSFLDWTLDTIRAPFNTAVTFTADLKDVDEGELAGMGSNGFPDDFYCYRWTRDNFYSFDDYQCNILFDCSHGNQTIPSEPSSDLNRDQVIAVAVGLGVGVPSLIIAVMTLLYTMRHPSASSSTTSTNAEDEKGPSRTSSTLGPSEQQQQPDTKKNQVTVTNSSISPSSTWSTSGTAS